MDPGHETKWNCVQGGATVWQDSTYRFGIHLTWLKKIYYMTNKLVNFTEPGNEQGWDGSMIWLADLAKKATTGRDSVFQISPSTNYAVH